MSMSFLEYYKMILEKVSFDRALFIKEYGKALKRVQPSEVEKLKAWVSAKGLVTLPSRGEGDAGGRLKEAA